jgi:hypothetical protein
MDTVVAEYSYEFDSSYRVAGTNAAPSFQLPSNVYLSHSDNYFEVQVMSVEIPYSFYTVVAPYNTVKVYHATSGTASYNSTVLSTIEPGNYTIDELLEALRLIFIALITATAAPVPVLSFTYSSKTGKVTLAYVSLAAGYNQTLSIDWNLSPVLMPGMFGFTNTFNDFSITSAGVKTSLTSPNAANVSPITSVSVRSSSLNQSSKYLERMGSSQWRQSTILASVPVQAPRNSWIFYDNLEQVVRLQQQSIDTIDLYVTSTTFDPINFNGIPWRIIMTIREKRAEHDVAGDNMIRMSRGRTQVGSKGLQGGLLIDEAIKKPRLS